MLNEYLDAKEYLTIIDFPEISVVIRDFVELMID